MPDSALVWFRNDLRLHDHRALHSAIRQAKQVVPVYIFDTRQFGKTSFGFPKTGAFRTKFLIESVQDLRKNLQAIGSDLVVRVGEPARILRDLARETESQSIFYGYEGTSEEMKVSRELDEMLAGTGIATASFWHSTLYMPEDIPYTLDKIPAVFTTFRKNVEHKGRIREPFPAPESLIASAFIDPGPIPQLEDFGFSAPIETSNATFALKGGESEGLKRLHYYIWESEAIKTYKITRNELLGADYSSKFSPWLANGCLSPRTIYAEIRKYESQVIENESTYWLIFELLWRDYFKYWALHHGNQIFQLGGIHPEQCPSCEMHREKFQTWAEGRTGMPFVDANMRELNATGFMSNRGRQNVASFLVNDLQLNWLAGAEYMESLLVDYDVCSNYGNWAYVAGVGADPRKDRYFNVMTQALRYDPEGDFVRHWIPALREISGEKVHYAFDLDPLKLQTLGVKIGRDYPAPVVRPKAWGVFDIPK